MEGHAEAVDDMQQPLPMEIDLNMPSVDDRAHCSLVAAAIRSSTRFLTQQTTHSLPSTCQTWARK